MKAKRARVLQRDIRLQQPFHPSIARSLETEAARSAPEIQRAPAFTRRRLLGGAGAAAAFGAGALLAPGTAAARGASCRPAAPRPIPADQDPDLAGLGLHVALPVPGREPSTVFDFIGKIAILDLIGDCEDEDGNLLAFRADLRTMQGTYTGLDGQQHHNTFGFI